DFVLWLLVGFATIAGHMFSIFLKLKGGKGVATSAGVLLGVFPYFTYPGLVAILTWIVLFMLTRYISVASIAGSGIFPIAYLIIALASGWDPFGRQLPLLVFAVLVAGRVTYKLPRDTARLAAGTGQRLG